MLDTTKTANTKMLLLPLVPKLVSEAGMCHHIRAMGLPWLVDQLDFPATLPLPKPGALIPVEFEAWSNPIFVQWVADEALFVFTRYNSALSKFHCLHCGGSKRCSHFVSMATKTPEQRKEQDQKRHQAILDDITSKCDQAGNIRCMSHSSVRFPRLNIQQLQVLQDRDGWIQRRIQLEAGVTQIATSGTGRYCFWLLVIGVPLILSVTQGRPASPN